MRIFILCITCVTDVEIILSNISHCCVAFGLYIIFRAHKFIHDGLGSDQDRRE
jgi:hypothetical protein